MLHINIHVIKIETGHGMAVLQRHIIGKRPDHRLTFCQFFNSWIQMERRLLGTQGKTETAKNQPEDVGSEKGATHLPRGKPCGHLRAHPETRNIVGMLVNERAAYTRLFRKTCQLSKDRDLVSQDSYSSLANKANRA